MSLIIDMLRQYDQMSLNISFISETYFHLAILFIRTLSEDVHEYEWHVNMSIFVNIAVEGTLMC